MYKLIRKWQRQRRARKKKILSLLKEAKKKKLIRNCINEAEWQQWQQKKIDSGRVYETTEKNE
jgi:hypothetical protein